MIQKIREGMTGKRVADVIYDNFQYILYEIGFYKEYDPDHNSGMGHIILNLKEPISKPCYCNQCPCNKKELNNLLTQEDFPQEYTIYEIKYDFDLNGGSIQIPPHCILYFNGGSINNGAIDLNGAKVIPAGWKLGDYFKDVELNNMADGQQFYYNGKLYIYSKDDNSNSNVVIDSNGNITFEDEDSFICTDDFATKEELAAAKQELINKINEVNRKVDQNTSNIAQNANNIAANSQRISTNAQNITSNTSKINENLQKINSNTNSINQLNNLTQSHTQQISQNKQRLDTLADTVTSLQGTLSNVQSMIDSLNDAIQELTNTVTTNNNTASSEIEGIKQNYYKIASNNGIIITDPQIWTGTEAQYNSITKRDNVLYMIK